MSSALLRAGLALLGVLVLHGSLSAQGGWTTEKHPGLGLTFPRPRDYEPIPTQPDEKHCVLRFAEKVTDKTREKRSRRPELSVLCFDKLPSASPPIGTDATPPLPIDDLETFVRKFYPQWRLGQAIEGKERDGFRVLEFSFLPGREFNAHAGGWVCSFLKGGRTISFLGVCDEEDLREQVKLWRYSAERVEFSEPEEPGTDKLERMYARLALPRAEYRIAIRAKLLRGWKAEDTEHYLVIHDTPDQPLVRKVVRDLELLHAEYERTFPPLSKIDAVSTVRICRSRDEYLSYGGPESLSGYWHASSGELVLYDAGAVDRGARSDGTFLTLYHEAFHQYIHYACGEVPPHSWFDEGHGDYYSGARVQEGKVGSIGVHPGRLSAAKELVDSGNAIPWKEILRFEHEEFCDDARIAACYAQAWSMIYFLRKSPVVEKRPEWARILTTYFATLRASYAKEMEALKSAGKQDDRRAADHAGVEARTRAVEAAFLDIDLDEIQAAWEAFVRELELPKRG